MGALRIEREDDVLRVTLARPETRNAFDAALIGDLAEAFVDVGTSRAVVLAGDGPSFCAGADVEWMRASADLGLEGNVADANALRRMFEAIDACPAPVVSVVHGHALGGGVGLVACSDVVIADPRTVFAFSEVKLGIVPAVISPFALRKIGESAALLLEPAARDSAAAMAAAAAWIQEQDRDGVAVFVSADHDIPDAAAFRRAAEQAVEAARGGRIVTLGVQPTFAATAFGYIRPGDGDGVRPVEAFVEKPDEARARQYVSEGYLWNSGNFVFSADKLLGEYRRNEPASADTVSAAVVNARKDLGFIALDPDAFSKARAVSSVSTICR